MIVHVFCDTEEKILLQNALHTISGRLVTDSASQLASQNNGPIRLVLVIINVRINRLTNITTVNNSSFISMVNSSTLCSSVARRTECVKQPPCL